MVPGGQEEATAYSPAYRFKEGLYDQKRGMWNPKDQALMGLPDSHLILTIPHGGVNDFLPVCYPGALPSWASWLPTGSSWERSELWMMGCWSMEERMWSLV